MKETKLLPILGLLIAGIQLQTVAQQLLPEVTVLARNYKYLKSVDTKEAAQPVKILQHRAAAYDIKNSEYYQDEYDNYSITFFLPDGYILAVYDSTGKLLNTAERFKNVALPLSIRQAVATRYPNWEISKDVYRVSYNGEADAGLIYKMVLQNGSKRLRVKANEKGEFLD